MVSIHNDQSREQTVYSTFTSKVSVSSRSKRVKLCEHVGAVKLPLITAPCSHNFVLYVYLVVSVESSVFIPCTFQGFGKSPCRGNKSCSALWPCASWYLSELRIWLPFNLIQFFKSLSWWNIDAAKHGGLQCLSPNQFSRCLAFIYGPLEVLSKWKGLQYGRRSMYRKIKIHTVGGMET